MYTIQRNPARLYNCDETGVTIVQHKHMKMLGLKGKLSGIFCSNRWMGISCDSRQMHEAKWTIHSSVTYIFKKIYETRTDEWHTALINPRVPSLGVDTEGDFHPMVSSFHQTYRADKIRYCYLSTGWALFTNTRNLEVITLAWEKHVDTFASLLTTVRKCHPWIKVSSGPWKYSTPK